jgi:hypothetical protein
MRQATTSVILVAAFAIASANSTPAIAGADAAATLARAGRLIDANDHATAVKFLEEALADAGPRDMPRVLELLRKSYEVLAKQAEAAGRPREAAHYRDNLAILSPTRPAAPKEAVSKAVAPSAVTANPASTPAPKPSIASPPTPVEPPQTLPIGSLLTISEMKAPGEPSNESRTSAPGEPSRDVPQPLGPLEIPSDTQVSGSDHDQAVKKANAPASQSAGAVDAPNDLPALPAPARAPRPVADALPEGQPVAEGAPTKPAEPDRGEADRLFAAKLYLEAGRLYSALARQNQLPADRKEQWAYCRWVDVVRRINLHPQTTKEWDDIDQEVRSIQVLAPKSWYGDYLCGKVSEARRAALGSAKQDRPVAPKSQRPDRGTRMQSGRSSGAVSPPPTPSEPRKALEGPVGSADRERPLALPGSSIAAGDLETKGRTQGESPDARLAAQTPPVLDPEIQRTGAETTENAGDWQVHATQNFRVYHHNPRLATAVGEIAESIRGDQARRWSSPAASRSWNPPCEIYLYPTGQALAAATSQPDTSPGFSAMEVTERRILSRRIHLRADHAQMRDAVLPHEVTHVVLADLFTDQPIPRWADEGIAVLAEPTAQQAQKAAELREPLDSGQLFPLDKLMSMDYPSAKDWGLYYAQSVSLTRFLAELGPPDVFVRFVRETQSRDVASALDRVYRIKGFEQLERQWQDYARRRLETPIAGTPKRPAPL